MGRLKSYFLFSLCLMVSFSFLPRVHADNTSDVILRLLIKKGIISEKEVDEIKAEVARTQTKAPAALEARVVKLEESEGFEFPDWIKNI